MAAKRSGLGRGLDALFPEKKTQEKVQKAEIKKESKTELKANVSVENKKEDTLANKLVNNEKEEKGKGETVKVVSQEPLSLENQVKLVKISLNHLTVVVVLN